MVYVSCDISIAMQAVVRVCDLCLVDIPRWIFFFSGLTFEAIEEDISADSAIGHFGSFEGVKTMHFSTRLQQLAQNLK